MILSAFWPVHQQPLLLGSLLAFRQELEMLAQIRNARSMDLYFDAKQLPAYVKEALLSKLPIRIIIAENCSATFDWPPKDPIICKWPYGSLKRISLLYAIRALPPILSWPANVEQTAEAIYNRLRSVHGQRVIAVHLKQQGTNTEESNADIDQWKLFFKDHPEITFVLLGNDLLPKILFNLPNVLFAQQQLKMRISVQLAFCKKADAFLGMASGICSAAICSTTPYVIFKHPLHHSLEMQEELGDTDSFSFAGQNQKLWRKLDSLENLSSALCVVNDWDRSVIYQK